MKRHWIVGEWVAQSNSPFHVQGFDSQARLKTRLELSRLIVRVYPTLDSVEKLQSIHFASKLLVTSNSPREAAVCELILSMGRADVQVDVRDRARMESNLIHTSIGLQHDIENITAPLAGKTLSLEQVKKLLLTPKPPASSLPLQDEDDESGTFRFGTLSSLVNRRAKAAYLALPKWAEKNSPSSLRDDTKDTQSGSKTSVGGWNVDPSKKNAAGFYDSENGKVCPLIDTFIIGGNSNRLQMA